MKKQTIIKIYVTRYVYWELLNARGKTFPIKCFDQFKKDGVQVIWTEFRICKDKDKYGIDNPDKVRVSETCHRILPPVNGSPCVQTFDGDIYNVNKTDMTVQLISTRDYGQGDAQDEEIKTKASILTVLKEYGFTKFEEIKDK